jgi:AcrR family transcriptional regulator
MKKSTVKDRIINLAKDKFFKYGFYRISLDSLVAELRTSKSSFYNHFESKDDLVSVILLELNREINLSLEKIINDKKLSFFGRLSAITEFTSNLLKKTSHEFLHDLRLYTPELWNMYLELREERINRYYRKLFDSGIQEGIIRNDLDPDLILQAYFKLTEIPIHSEDFRELELRNEEAYNQISILFMEGIRKKNSS